MTTNSLSSNGRTEKEKREKSKYQLQKIFGFSVKSEQNEHVMRQKTNKRNSSYIL